MKKAGAIEIASDRSSTLSPKSRSYSNRMKCLAAPKQWLVFWPDNVTRQSNELKSTDDFCQKNHLQIASYHAGSSQPRACLEAVRVPGGNRSAIIPNSLSEGG